ncbi:ABC transporter permease [Sphingobium chungbukense]|uniref:ABC transporter permease n=1 Tax=Sphingobium chungbukense TaxID=56193 RepID=A0A0M3AXX7_9SPHN|nr:ABC transporter permease [Sphingobium chungbukense]KKW93761.1 ABC transporter permease [Sphingobium chungbukense]
MKEMMRAAFVIARRDFTAVVLSRTFILFLLGPLFPIIIGMAFGGLGSRISSTDLRPVVGLAMPAADAARMEQAQARLSERMATQSLPVLRRVSLSSEPRAQLAKANADVVVIVSGSLTRPIMTGQPDDIKRLEGDISLIASAALAEKSLHMVHVEPQPVSTSIGAQTQGRLIIGRIAQIVIFFLTLLLAGMILSNLVEEKTNKIIEILAAAVPVDAIFLGKLMAMLAMSFVGIFFWGGTAFAAFLAVKDPGTSLAEPAMGWPLFLMLGLIYFAMAYTLLGSLFIGIGAQAATVREVQTLNMPVTMAQMLIFFFASYAVDKMGSPPEIAAVILPFSSPFAMIARAAQVDALWPHLLAIIWQMVWVGIIIRIGVLLFRRHVLKSGGGWWKQLFRSATG